MIKKILILAVVVALLGAGYVYYSSIQKPTDTYIASTSTTETESTNTQVTQTNTDPDTQMTESDTYHLDAGSVLGWKATKPTGFHTGTVQVTSGSISISNGLIDSAEFTVDMPSIKMLDIDNANLESEIRDDFFEADNYPVSYFVLENSQMVDGNMIVYGKLTIKDQTHPINFPVQITQDADKVNAQASFAIDRLLRGLTMWEGKANNYIEYTIDLNFTKTS